MESSTILPELTRVVPTAAHLAAMADGRQAAASNVTGRILGMNMFLLLFLLLFGWWWLKRTELKVEEEESGCWWYLLNAGDRCLLNSSLGQYPESVLWTRTHWHKPLAHTWQTRRRTNNLTDGIQNRGGRFMAHLRMQQNPLTAYPNATESFGQFWQAAVPPPLLAVCSLSRWK